GRLTRLPERKPFTDHELKILGLKASTEYLSETMIINRSGKVYRSGRIEFETEPGEGGELGKTEGNLASSAEVNKVSSIWGGDPDGSFGAKNAIDGEPGTEWSSQGEGNEAWIEIKLSKLSRVVGFGFWTRTMGETGQISRLRVLTGDGRVIGEYEIPSADTMYTFKVPEVEAEVIRFEVIDSSGGNTGAREIKIFGTLLD
ncbi:discoidin domain-containing protein, partial [Candidatus Bipolaricaulota bacterium]|nr:discoidin domain-containing protein [Candidatus Bipolaricaulota bacterium]